MRPDALVTLYLSNPLQAIRSRHGRIPILMYHSISSREETGHPYYQTVTSPEVFGAQMKYLYDNGYSTISVGDVVRCVEISAPSKSVVITFDDGFKDFHTHAFPLMDRYGFNATVYLPTAFIGKTAQKFKGIECLTWGQIRELHEAGVEFGSHTVTHVQLKKLKKFDIESEVRLSKETIEQELGSRVTSFAYPYAFPEAELAFIRQLRVFLEEAGYRNGVSTVVGTTNRADNRFFMRRLPVNGCDDHRLLRAKLEGAYDWLHAFQYSSKLMRTCVSRQRAI